MAFASLAHNGWQKRLLTSEDAAALVKMAHAPRAPGAGQSFRSRLVCPSVASYRPACAARPTFLLRPLYSAFSRIQGLFLPGLPLPRMALNVTGIEPCCELRCHPSFGSFPACGARKGYESATNGGCVGCDFLLI